MSRNQNNLKQNTTVKFTSVDRVFYLILQKLFFCKNLNLVAFQLLLLQSATNYTKLHFIQNL